MKANVLTSIVVLDLVVYEPSLGDTTLNIWSKNVWVCSVVVHNEQHLILELNFLGKSLTLRPAEVGKGFAKPATKYLEHVVRL